MFFNKCPQVLKCVFVQALDTLLTEEHPDVHVFKQTSRENPYRTPSQCRLDRGPHLIAQAKAPAAPIWVSDPPSAIAEIAAGNVLSPHYMNLDFAGPDGDMLHLLNEIVCMVDSDSQMGGFKLFYDNGEVTGPGNPGRGKFRTKQSFKIDGRGGERIVKLAVFGREDIAASSLSVNFSISHPIFCSRREGLTSFR